MSKAKYCIEMKQAIVKEYLSGEGSYEALALSVRHSRKFSRFYSSVQLLFRLTALRKNSAVVSAVECSAETRASQTAERIGFVERKKKKESPAQAVISRKKNSSRIMARRNVTTIPATISRFTATPINSRQKRKAAGYARASTDMEDQQSSYAAQCDYYKTYIQSREDWEFVGLFSDEGISATSTKYRDGFNKMIAQALAGGIDLIITKSDSCFARNTVDSLSTIRKLKGHGCECYFEKENIWTFDSKGELLITIMSSLAQEESRSISENCTWGQRKRFSDGKVTVPFGRFLGYDRGEDGNLVVNEEQAQIVRRIYGLFLQGRSPYTIAKMLTAESIPTPGGKKAWGTAVIKSILTNEKYKGDALLQKVYTTDFLSKKKKKNEGEIPQYYVEGNHEAIISPDVFDRVQLLIQANQTRERCKSYSNVFSGKIPCGDCGGWYGSKIWHSNDKYRKVIWQCNHKYSGGEKCTTPHYKTRHFRQQNGKNNSMDFKRNST